ncbi:CinA family protein [Cellulosimicrobium terreum]|nr:CinA family protein [Cellulosimicrobium terreum]
MPDAVPAGVDPAGSAPSAKPLLDRLGERGWTLAVAESLTGGLLASTLVEVPGASRVLRGGVVAYATDLKASLLGVDPDLLERRGPVDPDVALAMAGGVRRDLGADVGVSTTGVAGPDPQGGRAPGVVYVAVDAPGARRVVELRLTGSRSQVRVSAVEHALALTLEVVSRGTTDGRTTPRGADEEHG